MHFPSTSRILAAIGGVVVVLCISMGGALAENFAAADQVQIDDLISSLTLDHDLEQPLIRKARQVAPPRPEGPTADDDLNLADDVSEDYPVVFNIILFLAITLILALIAISAALATMDPGRDSLIYRVTSAQRFKKDN